MHLEILLLGKHSQVTVSLSELLSGSTAVHLGKKSDETATHRWKLYIRGPRNEDLSTFVQKVSFSLHPSFPEPVRGA
jgi:YEATS domain-containing protein 4